MSIFYIWSPWESQSKKALNDLMMDRISPLLEYKGFHSKRIRFEKKFSFPLYYERLRQGGMDLIRFQWMTYGRPWFVINFDRWDAARTDESSRAETALRFRARSNIGHFERWFGVGAFEAGIRLNSAADREIQSACRRIEEIDLYFKYGNLSKHMKMMFDIKSGKVELK